MNGFRRFMIGRYGGDQLSIALLILSVIFTFIGTVAGLNILIFLSYIPLILSILRMFSKNIQRRQMENYKFSMLMRPVYSKITNWIYRLHDSKTHKIFKCPQCKSRLRLPKGKGKISITCPKCSMEFIRKT
jgi:hypothetical protein